MPKPNLLSVTELREISNDAVWAEAGAGPGYVPSAVVLDLCYTIEILRDVAELIVKEGLND